jgi:hypothetical protein
MILFGNVLKIVGYVYLFIAGGFILINLFFIWANEGFLAVAEILNPWNIANLVVTLLTLAPGFLLLLASRYIKNKDDSSL